MSVDAIVVNFNAGASLRSCVGALLGGTVKPAVKVLDNASTDGSAGELRNLYGGFQGMEIVFNPTNIGFARAVNAAAGQSRAQYLLVINPDCVIAPDGLEKLLRALESDPSAALAAPAVRDSLGRFEKAALRRFPDPWNSFLTVTGLSWFGRWIPAFEGVAVDSGSWPETTSRAEAVSGACMLIRRQAMMDVGLLDESYGLHCEDLDLMYRLSETGMHCLLVPEADAVHEQGVSSRSRPLWVHLQKHRGMARFYNKFQASKNIPPVRWLVRGGIWLHFLVKLPVALLGR